MLWSTWEPSWVKHKALSLFSSKNAWVQYDFLSSQADPSVDVPETSTRVYSFSLVSVRFG